ncbi:Uncharacterised protein [Raoultella terrigena]|nr:Uncharacterised protein [Raoultella terrigena]
MLLSHTRITLKRSLCGKLQPCGGFIPRILYTHIEKRPWWERDDLAVNLHGRPGGLQVTYFGITQWGIFTWRASRNAHQHIGAGQLIQCVENIGVIVRANR